jgi:hypothetical protein
MQAGLPPGRAREGCSLHGGVGVGKVAVWVNEALELAETSIDSTARPSQVRSRLRVRLRVCVCVCVPLPECKNQRRGRKRHGDGEGAALEFWHGPPWSPTARRRITSPRGSTRLEGMNKLKLLSERFPRAPRLRKMLNGSVRPRRSGKLK